MTQKYYDENGNEVEVQGRPQKKRGGCMKWALIAIGAFVVLGIIGSMFGGDDTSVEPNEAGTAETATSNEEDEETTYGIGESVDVGGLSVTVNEKSNQPTAGNQYFN